MGGKYGDCLKENDEKPPTFYNGSYTKQNCDNTCLQKEVRVLYKTITVSVLSTLLVVILSY